MVFNIHQERGTRPQEIRASIEKGGLTQNSNFLLTNFKNLILKGWFPRI